MTATHPRRDLSIADAAEHFGLSTKTIRRRIADGQLAAVRIGGKRTIRISITDLEQLEAPIPTVGGDRHGPAS